MSEGLIGEQNAPATPLPPDRGDRRRRATLARDLTVLGVVGALLLAALTAGTVAIYRELYSPSAFVQHYLSLLAQGRAADALEVPGVGASFSALGEEGLPDGASDALLRSAALGSLSDVHIVSEENADGITRVTAAYRAGDQEATTTFEVEPHGWIGVAPAWRFARSPLASLSVVVRGSQTFEVNGFEMDTRQVSPLGADADPLTPIPLLVLTPGSYQVGVDAALTATEGEDVLVDTPLADTDVDIQAEPTPVFSSAVQKEVDGFLDDCTEQQLLNPTGCPFGYTVYNRIVAPPQWAMTQYPTIQLVPEGAEWVIAPTTATAHIRVDIRSLYDGSITPVDEDVLFGLDGTVTVRADGSISIRIGSPDV